ncbi:unnamed protein product [Cyclocybe aegerita]|uniref:Uncharacterized protein n=1 Tax=Cyclocybe aegerita TaxID=1973307 RepID=A0A8S0Y0M8_CYCAE|nr:unnamed protein product [Cyclocybe aegerita]
MKTPGLPPLLIMRTSRMTPPSSRRPTSLTNKSPDRDHPFPDPLMRKKTIPHRQIQTFQLGHRRIDAQHLQRLPAQRSQPTLRSVNANHIQSNHAPSHSSPLIQGLQTQLSCALSQLSDTKETIQRLRRQSDAHAEHTSNLVASLKGCNEEISTLTTQNRVQAQKIVGLEREVREVREGNRQLVDEKQRLMQELKDVTQAKRSTLEGLEAERDNWKEQLECMHLRMIRAEHRMRSLNLDPLLQDKFAARRESWIPARCKAAISWLTSGTADEVVQTRVQGIVEEMKKLNDDMAEAAGALVPKLEWTRSSGSRTWFSPLSAEPTAADRERAVKTVGQGVVTLMEAYAQLKIEAKTQTQMQTRARAQTGKVPSMLMQTVLETVVIHWCAQIIEGTYPRQRSFMDVLVELAGEQREDKTAGTGKPVKRVHVVPTAHSPSPSLPLRHHHVNVPFDINTCISDVLRDLARVLSVAGVCIPPAPPSSRSGHPSNRYSTTNHHHSASSSDPLFFSTLRPLLERAYDLRRATAEDNLHGLILAVCAPGAAFVGRYMLDVWVQPQCSYSLRGEKDKGMGECRAERRGVVREMSTRKVSGGIKVKRSDRPEGGSQINQLKAEYIAGTSGLGLYRFGALGEGENGVGVGGEDEGVEIVFLPRVRLVSALVKEKEVYVTG